MKILKTGCLFAVLLLLASGAQATIRYVSAQGAGGYTTLEAAASAAVTGDTILVGPGTYACGGINQYTKRLIWIGAGWDQTIVNLSSSWYINGGPGANRTSIEGMRLNSTTYVLWATNNADSSVVRRCILAGPYELIRCVGARNMTVEDCIFLQTTATGYPAMTISDSNYPTVVRGCVFANLQGNTGNFAFSGAATAGTLEIYNCVFLNYRQIFSLNAAGGAVIAVNNLFYDWSSSPTFGTYNPGSVFDYNASQTIAAPGSNTLTISSDPFVSYDESVNLDPTVANLHLDPTNGAAFVNTGHPSLLDFTDGSVSDFGVYGGPKPLVDNGISNYPWAINVTASPNLVGVGTPINASATGRVGPNY